MFKPVTPDSLLKMPFGTVLTSVVVQENAAYAYVSFVVPETISGVNMVSTLSFVDFDGKGADGRVLPLHHKKISQIKVPACLNPGYTAFCILLEWLGVPYSPYQESQFRHYELSL